MTALACHHLESAGRLLHSKSRRLGRDVRVPLHVANARALHERRTVKQLAHIDVSLAEHRARADLDLRDRVAAHLLALGAESLFGKVAEVVRVLECSLAAFLPL